MGRCEGKALQSPYLAEIILWDEIPIVTSSTWTQRISNVETDLDMTPIWDMFTRFLMNLLSEQPKSMFGFYDSTVGRLSTLQAF